MKLVLLICVLRSVPNLAEYANATDSRGGDFRDPQHRFPWDEALSTMSYHRSMMNEYLCRNYLANEILDAVRNETFGKRTGKPRGGGKHLWESMKDDSGSKKYKDWLSRSTTLEDIYRRYEDMTDAGENSSDQASHLPTDGEVTGYALIDDKVVGHGHGDFESGYGGVYTYEHEEVEESEEQGVKLKEMFDLALTAIAFLAFGTFITEAMMSALGVQTQEAQMMIVSPMPPPMNGISFKSAEEHQARSSRRAREMNILNEMSRRVLSSVEALSVAEKDRGKCLRRVLCDINKYSRGLDGSRKIWLPIWSFGASWIAGRFLKTEDYSLLENLKASLFGFGDADCEKLYGECQMQRRKRRK